MQSSAGQFVPFGDRLRRAAQIDSSRPALVHGERSLCWGETIELVGSIGAWLHREGIRRGDVLAICAPNSVEYALAFLGAAAAGIVVAPLPTSASGNALARMIEDCAAALVLVDEASERRIREAGCNAPISRIDGLLGCLGSSEAGGPEIGPHDVFNIIYSSGTTGRPKGIVQASSMRDAHVDLAAACGYGSDSVTLLSTPLYSNTTLVSFLPTMALGGTAIIMEKFDAEHFLELAERHRATHAMLVPVQYRRLLAHPDFDRFDLSAFREKFCTSAPFSAELKREVLDRWPGGLTEYYGMTEGGGLCILFAHRHPDKLHTVGQPAPDNDIRIIGERDEELAQGEPGEVVGRSRGMMLGYHKLPGDTEKAYWNSPEGDRFMRTGDIARFDEDGFLILMDRKKDVIISGGFNLYPSDLEEVVRAHPAVTDVAVVGVPSDDWGETPIAFVVAPGADAEAIREFANERLGRMQRLAAIVVIDRLPRSAIGKVLKRELRERWIVANGSNP